MPCARWSAPLLTGPAPPLPVQITPNGKLSLLRDRANLRSKGLEPLRLHSGPLLGMTCLRSSAAAAGALPPHPADDSLDSSQVCLRFVSWQDLSPLGPELPNPSFLSWDPSNTYCLLAYRRRLDIYSARAAGFRLVASLAIEDATSAYWHARQVFVSTASAVHVIFVGQAPSAAQVPPQQQQQGAVPVVQSMLLASHAAHPASALATGSRPGPSIAASVLESHVQVLPAGSWSLVGTRDGCLWLAGPNGACYTLWLGEPAIKAR